MGLTIHYDVEFKGSKEALIKKLEAFRNFCLDLPFAEVDKVSSVDITKKHIEVFSQLQSQFAYPNNSQENLAKRDLIMSKLGVKTDQINEIIEYTHKKNSLIGKIKPTSVVYFKIWAGEDCEGTSFTFKQKGKKWVCRGFTKTQYATEFVKCHLLVIRALDYLKDNGFIVEVKDEGEYWETKDLKVLGKNINEFTSLLSSVSGELKEIAKKTGMTVESAIDKCKNIVKVD